MLRGLSERTSLINTKYLPIAMLAQTLSIECLEQSVVFVGSGYLALMYLNIGNDARMKCKSNISIQQAFATTFKLLVSSLNCSFHPLDRPYLGQERRQMANTNAKSILSASLCSPFQSNLVTYVGGGYKLWCSRSERSVEFCALVRLW